MLQEKGGHPIGRTINFPPNMLAWIDKQVKKKPYGSSRSEIVREAIREYMKKGLEPKP